MQLDGQKGKGRTITAALVAELPEATDTWLSFGFSDPQLNRTDMVGGDVAVAGTPPSPLASFSAPLAA